VNICWPIVINKEIPKNKRTEAPFAILIRAIFIFAAILIMIDWQSLSLKAKSTLLKHKCCLCRLSVKTHWRKDFIPGSRFASNKL